MSKKYYFQEKDFKPDLHKFSTDASQLLQEKIKQYSIDKSKQNKHVLFAFQESLRLIRKLEEAYLKKEMENSQ